MKKCLAIVLIGLFFNSAYAQVLYTENFNSYTTGNVGTDITGTIVGKGGWYTKSVGAGFNPVIGTNSDYQIVAEPTRGNVVEIASFKQAGEYQHFLYRNDLKTYWQQRTPGNNVLKLAFDVFYTGYDDKAATIIHLFSNEGRLVNYGLTKENLYIARSIGTRLNSNVNAMGLALLLNGKPLQLPLNVWTTLEIYIDYNTSKIYFSIPSINYTVVENAGYNFDLSGVEHDDSPVQLMFFHAKGADMMPTVNSSAPRFDNINISAQNKVPVVTVGLNEHLSSQFDLYPNPATNFVNIINSENMLVQQITIYDIAGKQLNTQTFNNQAEIQLNVENLSNGSYMLHIQTNKGMAVKKLVKK